MKASYIILLGLPLIMTGCHKNGKDASQALPSIEVSSPVTDSVVDHRAFPGTIEAANKADVVARVNGTLLRKCFRDGDYVSKGQLLYVIESTTYRNAVTEAQAQLAAAQSRRSYYSRQYEAMKKAYASDAVSQMNVIETENNLKQAESDINTASAQLSDARTNLAYCNVTAPISGRVTASLVDVGNYVNGTGSPTVLCSIVDNNSLKISFDVDNVTFAGLLPEGINHNGPLFTAVPLTFREPLKNHYTTDLYYSAPSVSSSTGTVTLKNNWGRRIIGYVRNIRFCHLTRYSHPEHCVKII
ncbi:MAG: efflux RND transporter periplasmic adaptor subunit [Muribaculaceae bacterium]|nr:efflux RND transporter periplasmic adaptor subunit [Muribaculaceae bacterium]